MKFAHRGMKVTTLALVLAYLPGCADNTAGIPDEMKTTGETPKSSLDAMKNMGTVDPRKDAAKGTAKPK